MSSNFEMYNDLETLLQKIRDVVNQKRGWIERKEICEILGLPLNTQLVEEMRNSKIGQLLYQHLRKEGFLYQKVQLDPEDKFQYEIWMCSPEFASEAPNSNQEEKSQSMLGVPAKQQNVSEDLNLAQNSSENKSQGLNSILKELHGENYILAESKRPLKKKEKKVKEQEPEDDLDTCDNEYLGEIIDLINQGKNIFITGYAGTGKSFILNKLKHKFSIDVTSTTGLAAVNVQGQTIHSWAGVGICNKPIEDVIERILKRSKLKKQITECKILAIDEISMLDGVTLDYIDRVLRIIREEDVPMGGIQVIFLGDFFQLPPVTKEKGFCFQSLCWDELDLKTIFLEKIYRQSDERFIKALNNLRLNQMTSDDIALFYSRQVDYDTYESDMLHIFGTNNEADNYNNFKFRNVSNPLFVFKSVDQIHRAHSQIIFDKDKLSPKLTKFDVMTWEMFNKSCKAPSELTLKVGCKVMLLKNLNFEQGLINGATGTVLEIEKGTEDEHILVHFDNGIEANIPINTFEAYRDGEVVVSRDQYPLRLAYGITIHKSQGMTLDKLVVDCKRVFEYGQVYVALSRIRSLDGLFLKSFSPDKVMSNPTVVEFYKNLRGKVLLQ